MKIEKKLQPKSQMLYFEHFLHGVNKLRANTIARNQRTFDAFLGSSNLNSHKRHYRSLFMNETSKTVKKDLFVKFRKTCLLNTGC